MTITWVKSPNYTVGRSKPVTKVIIHWIVGSLATADATFKNPSSGVSAHYGVENSSIHQYVKEQDTAWHAISANPFSIGIEHSAAPDRPASETTYKSTAQLIADICKRYNLDPDTAIEPHNKYVATQCPGSMDLGKIKKMVKDNLGGNMSFTQEQIKNLADAGGIPQTPAQLADGATKPAFDVALNFVRTVQKDANRWHAEAVRLQGLLDDCQTGGVELSPGTYRVK